MLCILLMLVIFHCLLSILIQVLPAAASCPCLCGRFQPRGEMLHALGMTLLIACAAADDAFAIHNTFSNGLSFWPSLSWESRPFAVETQTRKPIAAAAPTVELHKKKEMDPDVLSRIQSRMSNCFLSPFECQLQSDVDKGTVLLRQKPGHPPIFEVEEDEARRVEPSAANLELARAFRNNHAHYLYNPLFRMHV